MQAPLRHGARTLLALASPSHTQASGSLKRFGAASWQDVWTCSDCRNKLQRQQLIRPANTSFLQASGVRRSFTTSTSRPQDGKAGQQPISSDPKPSFRRQDPAPDTPASSSTSLPSHTEKLRWTTSKRMEELMDKMLTRASLASQHINTWTGTDYSGIEALRKEIVDQEQKVRECHAAVSEAKTRYTDAHSQQGTSQKEIVSLLERKSSWAPTDLERYMSLVRSEHLNDQAIQSAKENVAAAERELEDTRALMEKLERKQYHEEQIWSDTIRRNSTWVTMGLMGVNIFLLLAQIAIFEPYRRRKIVSQVKAALDEKSISVPQLDAERQVDQVIEPATPTPEIVESVPISEEAQVPAEVQTPTLDQSSSEPLDAILPTDDLAINPPVQLVEDVPPAEAEPIAEPPLDHVEQGSTAYYKAIFQKHLDSTMATVQDLFSERVVQMRKFDLTMVALQGTATGVAVVGLLFVAMRPR